MKTVLITGANRGIGLAFAQQYANEGWKVLACTRQLNYGEGLSGLVAKYPDQVLPYELDVVDHEQIDRLSDMLSHVSIDLLINNAGIYPKSGAGEFGEIDYDAWADSFRVNTMAPLKLVESFSPQITCSELKTIVTITSKMGSVTDNKSGGSYIYRSSKLAVNIVMKSLAIDLKSFGITAVLLHPGWVKTDMGGAGGLITAEQSVTGMRKVIDQLTPEDSGCFYAFDGQVVPW